MGEQPASRAAMQPCFIWRLFLKRSLKNSRELKKLLWQLFGKETALKWHFVYKLVNNQAKDGDGASPDRIVASQHNIMASQDNVVPSQDNVVPSQDMVALKVEVVALHRGGPGGARQVGRAPHTFDFQ